jgi:hypothetical protein
MDGVQRVRAVLGMFFEKKGVSNPLSEVAEGLEPGRHA